MFRIKNMKNSLARFCACILCAALLCGMFSVPTASAAYERRSDNSTINDWEKYFGSNVKSSLNAGGVWADKSVFMDADLLNRELALQASSDGHSIHPGSVSFGGDNFMAVLSAIASNKAITGHSTIPTDTVFVLDFSGSMANANNNARIRNMIPALNDAIQRLMELNVANRVGVVIYYGIVNSVNASKATESSKVLMPLGRYKAENEKYLQLVEYSANQSYSDKGNSSRYPFDVKVVAKDEKTGITLGVPDFQMYNYATYLQHGLLRAWHDVFSDVTSITVSNEEDPLQEGARRMPIMVLMSDGAPTATHSDYKPEERVYKTSTYDSNGGNSRTATTSAEMGFVTQLTASWVRKEILNKYNSDGKGHDPLVYTLGLSLDSDTSGQVAKSILDPVASMDAINNLWQQYLARQTGEKLTLFFQEPGKDNNAPKVSREVAYDGAVTLQNYVNRYFAAEQASDLTNAFQNIVHEIVLQSLYYPTDADEEEPQHDGYLNFVDELGKYMEVKKVHGIVFGGKLYTGYHFAHDLNEDIQKVQNNGAETTPLLDEFIRSGRTRMHITKAQAHDMVEAAWENGDLRFNSETDYSNRLGWYVGEQGQYLASYRPNDSVPDGAKYLCYSYCFLDEDYQSGVNDSLLYVVVQVHTDLQTKQSHVVMKVPATLIPMISDEFTYKDINAPNSEIIRKRTENTPIRLLYEVGLRDDIHEYNVAQMVKEPANPDGSYTFYTNLYDETEFGTVQGIQGSDESIKLVASQFQNTIAYFDPSPENERYYFITPTALYVKDAQGAYEKYTAATRPENDDQEYYVAYEYFDWSSGSVKKELHYEPASIASITAAVEGTDGWYVPKGTVRRQTNQYAVEKNGSVSPIQYVNYPFVLESSVTGHRHVSMVLGNNGVLKLMPTNLSLEVAANKQMITADGSTASPQGFVFKLTELDALGNLTHNVVQALSDENGTISFQVPISSSQFGTTEWLLTEEQGIAPGVTYSTEQYKLKITVSRDATTGNALHSFEWTLPDGNTPAVVPPMFTNEFTPPPPGDGDEWYEWEEFPPEPTEELPATGDSSRPEAWIALAAISLMGVLLALNKKRV